MTRALAILLAGTIVAAASACARRTPAGLEPCTGELESLCSRVKPGEGRLLACLRDHQGELSDGCRQRVTLLSPPEASSPMGPQALQACRLDLQVLCSGVAPGEGRLKQCLMARSVRVSPPCKAALEAETGAAKPPAAPTP